MLGRVGGVANPFKIFVVIGVVIALALAVWFVYVFFVDPGNHGSTNHPSEQGLSLQVTSTEVV